MKTAKVFLSIIVVFTSFSSYGQSYKKDSCFYEIRVPPDIDMPKTPHFDTTIVKNSQCSRCILILQSWGTETSYTLFAGKDTLKSTFYVGSKGIMDISKIEPGIYTMWLTACGNGGFFTVRIK